MGACPASPPPASPWPSLPLEDIAHAEPYLKEAMLEVVQGKPVAHAVTRPYGCSIKY